MDLDIAPFALEIAENDARILRWEEPRDILRLELEYPGGAPLPGSVRVEYWKDKWPGNRPREEDLEPGRAGRAAWRGIDDWFNGRWVDARTDASGDEMRLILTFEPLTCEMPDAGDYDVTFRRTIQIRLSGVSDVASVKVFTGTPMVSRDMRIELGCGLPGGVECEGDVEVYNGYLEDFPGFREGRTTIRALCARPGPFSHDATVVTVRSHLSSFSFRPDDLVNGPIWIPDLKALVSLEEDLGYSPGLVGKITAGENIYSMVAGEPEQTLARALREQPPKRPMHFIVGIEGRRQKFGVEPSGDVFAGLGMIHRVPGPDTGRLHWNARRLYIRFHWEQMTPNGRFLEEGYLPIHRARFSRGSLDIEQEVFATRVAGDLSSDPIKGEDPVMAVVRLVFKNTGDEGVEINQRFSSECMHPNSRENLNLIEGLVYADPDSRALRMAIDTGGRGELTAVDGDLYYKLDLEGHGSHEVVVKIPFVDLLTPEEIEELLKKEWSEEREVVRTYWKSRVDQGTRIRTGIQDIDDFHRALVTHILINDDHEVGSDRVIGRVSSFNYGNFPNEAVMQILELDRRGYHEEAERHLETYLYYQGTVPLPGNFSGKEGLFYGSGGYEHGDYNQHHGWVLWGLAEHYRYTRDDGWLRRIAGRLVAGCDWVIRERESTKRLDGSNRCLEYGYLPAGSLEDVREFCYWLSTNALTCRGLTAAGEVLTEIGHNDGPRILEDAREYRRDIAAGIRESTVRSPVVRLRDGTYVPHVPSRLYWRGRDVGWIREVLEGAIIAVGTVLEPGDEISTWIMKDFEGNRYLDSPYNYALDDFGSQWFSRGGFSMQPNLIYGLSPYLDRDQIQHYLRAFFNGFAACWRTEIRSMTEHPLPTLADWKGDHFKSSDESMVSYSLRSMFVHEEPGALFLGKGIPRGWLKGEARIGIERASTYFGQLSFWVDVPENGRMRVEVNLPRERKPGRVFIRLRHPGGWEISGVEGTSVQLGKDGETLELLSKECEMAFEVSLERVRT